MKDDLGCSCSCRTARACTSSAKVGWQPQVAALGFLGTVDPCGRLDTCQLVLPKPGTLHGNCRPGEHSNPPCWGEEGKCVEMLPYTRQEVSSTKQIPSCPAKTFLLNMFSFSWAKLLCITTLHISSVQEEQARYIKGVPLWGERERVEGWSVNQLSDILAFSWWIRLCRCFVAWLTKRLIYFFFLYHIPQCYSYTTWFYQDFF